MIKKFKQFLNEGILGKLKGPSNSEYTSGLEKEYGSVPSYYLIIAARDNYLPDVKRGIELGGDINKIDLLSIAIDNDNLEMFNFLIDNGADITIYFNYPLYSAIIKNDLKYVKILVENGADVNQPYRYGGVNYKDSIYYTALDLVRMKGYTEIEKYLLDNGAVSIKDVENIPTDIYYVKNSKDLIKEGLLSKLQGPTKEEMINNLKSNPLKLYNIALNQDDEELKEIASKLITQKDKMWLIDYMLEIFEENTMIRFSENGYDEDDMDEEYDIYGLQYKIWKDYIFGEDYKKAHKKLLDEYMKMSLDDLLYLIYDNNIEIDF